MGAHYCHRAAVQRRMVNATYTEGGATVIKRLFVEEEGQTLVEYGLLVSLIALVVIAILTVLGQKVRNLFVTVNTNIKSST